MPCRNWGCRDRHSLDSLVLVSLRAGHSRRRSPGFTNDRDHVAPRILFSPHALTFQPGLPAVLAWLEEPDWLAGCCAPPTDGWTVALVRQGLEAAFPAPRWCLLAYSAAGAGGLGPVPACQPAYPQETTVQVARVWCPGVPTAQAHDGGGKVRRCSGEEKLLRSANFYGGRSFAAAPQNRGQSSSCATTAGARATQRKQQRSHRQRLGRP